MGGLLRFAYVRLSGWVGLGWKYVLMSPTRVVSIFLAPSADPGGASSDVAFFACLVEFDLRVALAFSALLGTVPGRRMSHCS
jgi:hypothetical protein